MVCFNQNLKLFPSLSQVSLQNRDRSVHCPICQIPNYEISIRKLLGDKIISIDGLYIIEDDLEKQDTLNTGKDVSTKETRNLIESMTLLESRISAKFDAYRNSFAQDLVAAKQMLRKNHT